MHVSIDKQIGQKNKHKPLHHYEGHPGIHEHHPKNNLELLDKVEKNIMICHWWADYVNCQWGTDKSSYFEINQVQ